MRATRSMRHDCPRISRRTFPGRRPGRERLPVGAIMGRKKQRSCTISGVKLAHGHFWRQAASVTQGCFYLEAYEVGIRFVQGLLLLADSKPLMPSVFFAAKDRLRGRGRSFLREQFEPGCDHPTRVLVSFSVSKGHVKDEQRPKTPKG